MGPCQSWLAALSHPSRSERHFIGSRRALERVGWWTASQSTLLIGSLGPQ